MYIHNTTSKLTAYTCMSSVRTYHHKECRKTLHTQRMFSRLLSNTRVPYNEMNGGKTGFEPNNEIRVTVLVRDSSIEALDCTKIPDEQIHVYTWSQWFTYYMYMKKNISGEARQAKRSLDSGCFELMYMYVYVGFSIVS